MPNILQKSLPVKKIKPWVYKDLNRSRALNASLDVFGKIAHGFSPSYIPGRSRACYFISSVISSPTELKIKEAGFFAGEKLIINNPFFAQTFLEQGYTGIQLCEGFSPEDLLSLSKTGQAVQKNKARGISDPQNATRLLETIKDKNLMLQLRTFGFAAIFSSLSYLFYRASNLAYLKGSISDYFFSSLMLAGIAFDVFLVMKNQQHLISGQKYVFPTSKEETKELVAEKNGPRAAILVPAYNEPIDVMEKTLLAAGRQEYQNKEVLLLLDDKPTDASIPAIYQMVKNVNQQLQTEGRAACVKVFQRKKYSNVLNKTLNKADNLNAFFVYAKGKSLVECKDIAGNTVILSREEYAKNEDKFIFLNEMEFGDANYFTIIDADYELIPSFLTETVSLLAEKPNIALVQTPQNLIPTGESEVERISALGINANWRYARRGNAQDGSIFWGGTNCTLRWEALESIKQENTDGMGKTEFVSTKNITEDLYTSLLLIKKGWDFDFIARPMAKGMPINNLADHFATFWRYVEGTMEATLEVLIPHMAKNPRFIFSKKGMEFISHALQGLMGYPMVFFCIMPSLASVGIDFPPTNTLAFLGLMGISLIFNARNITLTFKKIGGRPFDELKCGLLFILHSPTYIHATLTAIKNVLTGTRAKFLRTPKDGNRSAIPLKYLAPLIAIPTLNLISFYTNLTHSLTGKPWMISPALWSLVMGGGFTYGLLYFNGLKNTWKDLKLGIGQFFRKN